MSVRSLIFLLAALPLKAATVRLYLSGVITEENLTGIFNPPPSTVGSRWELEVFYPHPVAPDNIGETYLYFPLTGSFTFRVANLFWSGGPIAVQAWSGPTLPNQYFGLGGDAQAASDTQFLPATFGITVRGPDGVVMLRDLTSLPASLDDWDLRLASFFQFRVAKESGQNRWEIISRNYDALSLSVVPEPSAAGLAVAGALVMGRRRRRVAA